ncbi:P-loop ATPase, Sll1717 family [Lysinibacillus sp. 54212]|uniref:P-loop ATPase, Sll1717 family n=1 Tax=Lysinibacillus sp. 54212 TaxID=3119829 RepID=UPI002FC826C5
MRLEEYEFGFADAEKEFSRVPEIFERAFYDFRGTVDKLMKSYYFLLIGRKGVGKSAVSARIQSISNHDSNFHAFPVQLNDFEFATFAKTSIDKELVGTQKYKDSWDLILLLTAVKIVNREMNLNGNKELKKLLASLDDLGFASHTDYKNDVTRLSKLKVGANMAIFDLVFEKEFGSKPDSFLERVSTLKEKIIDVLNIFDYRNNQITLLIDGVDDILRIKKNQLEILMSLIRSVDYLNDKFHSKKIPIKVILFIREDIVNKVTDPDLNKIKRDGAILLNWNSKIDDLKSVVNLRFEYSGLSKEDAINQWDVIFPKKIRNRDSWQYILDHTLYKPRDILQLLKCAQSIYPEKQKLSYSEIRNVLKDYSKNYFIEEMKNEITGFIDDSYINCLPPIFQKIGERSFSLHEFSRYVEEQISKPENDKDARYLLLLLFEAGYVGQLISNTRNSGKSVMFKYWNENSQIDYSNHFIIHKGLYNGLGIRGI